MSGLDVLSDDHPSPSLTGEHDPYVVDHQAVSEEYYFADQFAKQGDPANNEDYFFNASDQELEQWSKGVVKLERKRRSVGLKILLVIIILLFALAGAGLFLYTQGYGFPTQETVAQNLFANPSDKSLYVNGMTDADIKDVTDIIEEGSTVTVDGVDRSMSASKVYVTAKTPEGGDVTYAVSMVRDMIGWKVSDVELYFASQN
jgi:hypothetical protein